MEDPFIVHCSTCRICSDNGGTYRLCTTGASLCAGEQQPRLTPSGAWEKAPNVAEQLILHGFNNHAAECKICYSACTSGKGAETLAEERDGEEQKLCHKGNRAAQKVTKRYWMDQAGVVKGMGEGVRECVVEEGEERGKVVRVREKDIMLGVGEGFNIVRKMLERDRDEKFVGREFIKRKRTFREIFHLGK